MSPTEREDFLKKIEEKFINMCDNYFLCELLILSAGMMGAYTVTMRGNVFCNAQTLNIVMMGIELGKGDFSRAAYYLIPFAAYLCGALFATLLPIRMKRVTSSRYEIIIISGEAAIMLAVGFIPLSAPVQIAQIAINFAASMQFATFRKSQGYPMATTFVTNHVRQIGTFLIKYHEFHNPEDRKRCLKHVRMLVNFFVGAFVLTAMEGLMQEKVIWLALLPLGFCLAVMIRNNIIVTHDVAQEKVVVSSNSILN